LPRLAGALRFPVQQPVLFLLRVNKRSPRQPAEQVFSPLCPKPPGRPGFDTLLEAVVPFGLTVFSPFWFSAALFFFGRPQSIHLQPTPTLGLLFLWVRAWRMYSVPIFYCEPGPSLFFLRLRQTPPDEASLLSPCCLVFFPFFRMILPLRPADFR